MSFRPTLKIKCNAIGWGAHTPDNAQFFGVITSMRFIDRKRICADCDGQGCPSCKYRGEETVLVGHVFDEETQMFHPVFPHDWMGPIPEDEFDRIFDENGIYEG